MRIFLPFLLVGACTNPGFSERDIASPDLESPPVWTYALSEDEALLRHSGAGAKSTTILSCRKDGSLAVHVAAFSPVASEERMSIGAGDVVTTLVADFRGDSVRGGVDGEAPVPGELKAIVTNPAGIHVNYGYQNIGLLPAVPAPLGDQFLKACRA